MTSLRVARGVLDHHVQHLQGCGRNRCSASAPASSLGNQSQRLTTTWSSSPMHSDKEDELLFG